MNKTKKLWQKATTTHPLVKKYSSWDDIFFDQQLVSYDVYGSLAHIAMLKTIDLMSATEHVQVKTALTNILTLYKKGAYQLNPDDEDVHTRIENDVSQKSPNAGAKIHTGRSRNDQVLVDLRLFTKDHLHSIALESLTLIEAFLAFATKHEWVPMPGYTHMQPAMLSSVGLWSAQFAESLLGDLKLFDAAYALNDQSPLGSGAAYGVSLPIDRTLTTKHLGFAKVQNNTLYCQNSRGKIEGAVVHAFVQMILTLSRFAQDVLIFTSAEYGFFSLPDTLTTGSSSMPQKKNLDIMELVRARAKTMLAYEVQILSIVSGLPSGYNRDLQETKRPYLEAFLLLSQTLAIVHLTITQIKVNQDKLLRALTKDLFATHHAYRLMEEQHLPFRQAYKNVGTSLEKIPAYDPLEVLKQTKHLGAPGNLGLKEAAQEAKTTKKVWQQRSANFAKTLKRLIR